LVSTPVVRSVVEAAVPGGVTKKPVKEVPVTCDLMGRRVTTGKE
jgi:hypothetical protein